MADKELKFEYQIGSNVVTVDGKPKYLNIIVWNEVTYDQIKENIVE